MCSFRVILLSSRLVNILRDHILQFRSALPYRHLQQLCYDEYLYNCRIRIHVNLDWSIEEFNKKKQLIVDQSYKLELRINKGIRTAD